MVKSRLEGQPTKGERTRARLLAAAAAEFAEHGFEAARISDIVARAELSQPAFYMYFVNKGAAYQELVDLFRTRIRMIVAAARLPDDLPADKVGERTRNGVLSLLTMLDQDRNLTRIGFFQAGEADGIKAELVELIATNVAAEQAAGIFRDDIPAVFFAQCLVGIVERLTRFDTGPDERKQQATLAADLLLCGLKNGS
jgi:AcrR family transcriptional regulator